MSIKIQLVDDKGWVPQIFCDLCGRPVKEYGNVLWRAEIEGQVQIYHLHKQCTRAFELTNPAEAGWCFEELDTHLALVAHNARLDLGHGMDKWGLLR